MRREERPTEGWYYRHNGPVCGPVSAEHLQHLLTTGRLQPRQAVWQQGSQGLLLVHAATAACGTTAPSELVPA